MIPPILAVLIALWVKGSVAASPCALSAVDEAVPAAYCDLVSHPETYFGRRILTEANVVKLPHSLGLGDPRCASSASRNATTVPIFPKEVAAGAAVETMAATMQAGGKARLDLIGVFGRADSGPMGGVDGQAFEIKVECLLSVRPFETRTETRLPPQ